MITINNDTKEYWFQYEDIEDDLRTPEIEPKRTCNVTHIAMITGENPNTILKYFQKKYGLEIGIKSPHYQWQELLMEYLNMKGFKTKPILEVAAYPRARNIRDSELKKMISEIRIGNVISYHKNGHYQLMTGFNVADDGKMISFIFNDPAGDRKLPLSERNNTSGHRVEYSYKMIKSEKIYGMCYCVEL